MWRRLLSAQVRSRKAIDSRCYQHGLLKTEHLLAQCSCSPLKPKRACNWNLFLGLQRQPNAFKGAKENVATTGTWNIHPNVMNAIPRGASILFDIRDVDKDRRQKVIQAALDGAHATGKKRKVKTQAEVVYAFPPVTSNEKVCLAVARRQFIWVATDA